MGNSARLNRNGTFKARYEGIVGINPQTIFILDAMRAADSNSVTRKELLDILIAKELERRPELEASLRRMAPEVQKMVSDFKLRMRKFEAADAEP